MYKFIIAGLLLLFSYTAIGVDNEYNFIVKSGDSISKYLQKLSVPQNILWSIMGHKNSKSLNNLQIGHKVTIKLNNNKGLLEIKYQASKNIILVYTYKKGKVTSNIISKYPITKLTKKTITIKNSLFYDGKKAGVNQQVLEMIYKEFKDILDFAYDIQKGDKFTIISKKYSNNSKPEAIYYIGKNKLIKAYLYNKKYYYDTGYLLNSLFTAPLKHLRISSKFNKKRFHPVLKKYRHHKGVDFVAKTGTPVYASRSGIVRFIRISRGYGKVVYINHDKKYTTVYAHLSKFAKGLKEGAAIKRGDLIGLVGKTGLVTGAHLHFETRIYNEHQDPIKMMAKKLSNEHYISFKHKVYAIDNYLAQ